MTRHNHSHGSSNNNDYEWINSADVVYETFKEYPPSLALLTSKVMDELYEFVMGCRSKNRVGITDGSSSSSSSNSNSGCLNNGDYGCRWVCDFTDTDEDNDSCHWDCPPRLLVENIQDGTEVAGWRWYLPEHWTTDDGWFAYKYRLRNFLFFRQGMSYMEFVVQQQQQQQVQPQPQTPQLYDHLQWMYTFAKTPNTDLGNVTSPTAAVVVFVLMMIIRICKLRLTIPYFSSIGRKLLPKPKTATATPTAKATALKKTYTEQEREDRIYKFGEYFHKLFYHSFISIYGVYYIYYCNPHWWTDPRRHLWKNWAFQRKEPGIIWYYLIQCAYNLDALIYLLQMSFTIQWKSISLPSSKKNTKTTTKWGEPLSIPIPTVAWSPSVRGDFNEMFIHHVITNLLIVISSFFEFTRIGSMVFVIHDVSEIPIDLSKLANFLKWKRCTTYGFVTMVLVWCMTRLYVLPFVIYRTIVDDTFLLLHVPEPAQLSQEFNVDARFAVFKALYPIFIILLRMLIALHVVWFTMFIRMAVTLFSKGEAHDYSEHPKGEAYYGGRNHHHHQATTTLSSSSFSSTSSSSSSSSSTPACSTTSSTTTTTKTIKTL